MHPHRPQYHYPHILTMILSTALLQDLRPTIAERHAEMPGAYTDQSAAATAPSQPATPAPAQSSVPSSAAATHYNANTYSDNAYAYTTASYFVPEPEPVAAHGPPPTDSSYATAPPSYYVPPPAVPASSESSKPGQFQSLMGSLAKAADGVNARLFGATDDTATTTAAGPTSAAPGAWQATAAYDNADYASAPVPASVSHSAAVPVQGYSAPPTSYSAPPTTYMAPPPVSFNSPAVTAQSALTMSVPTSGVVPEAVGEGDVQQQAQAQTQPQAQAQAQDCIEAEQPAAATQPVEAAALFAAAPQPVELAAANPTTGPLSDQGSSEAGVFASALFGGVSTSADGGTATSAAGSAPVSPSRQDKTPYNTGPPQNEPKVAFAASLFSGSAPSTTAEAAPSNGPAGSSMAPAAENASPGPQGADGTKDVDAEKNNGSVTVAGGGPLTAAAMAAAAINGAHATDGTPSEAASDVAFSAASLFVSGT